MKKVFKLTIYRKPKERSVWGGTTTKEVRQFDSKEAALDYYDKLKDRDETVSGKALAVDWK